MREPSNASARRAIHCSLRMACPCVCTRTNGAGNTLCRCTGTLPAERSWRGAQPAGDVKGWATAGMAATAAARASQEPVTAWVPPAPPLVPMIQVEDGGMAAAA
jgi:hypothetical protein